MAQLGVTRLVDIIRRTDLLKSWTVSPPNSRSWRCRSCWRLPNRIQVRRCYCTENKPPFDNGLLNAQLLQRQTVCR
ncbi:hypothetical protein ACNKHW_20485 [Shigella flexneri]